MYSCLERMEGMYYACPDCGSTLVKEESYVCHTCGFACCGDCEPREGVSLEDEPEWNPKSGGYNVQFLQFSK